MDKLKFGNKIHFLREEKGLSQKQLAEILDVSDKAISKWEHGQSIPRMETLEKMAEVLGIAVEDLLTDDEAFVERRKTMFDGFRYRDKNIQTIFKSFGLGIIFLDLISCAFDCLVFFVFDKSELARLIEQNISILSFPLTLLIIFAVINGIGVPLVSGIKDFLVKSPNAINLENERKSALLFVNRVCSLFSFFPMIFVYDSDFEKTIIDYIIIYAIDMAILAGYFFTTKYDNIDLYFTPNGMFEKSINYGEFHPYSTFENVVENYNDFVVGKEARFQLSFEINNEKFKVQTDKDSEAKRLSEYLAIECLEPAVEEANLAKLSPVRKAGIVVGAIIMAMGFILFMSNMQFGTTEIDYTKAYDEVVPMYGSTTVVKYDDKLFCLSDQNSAVDVFDLNGKFLYANRVSLHQNGENQMYIKNDNLYIISKDNDVYRYDLNGKYLGRCVHIWNDYDKELFIQYDGLDNIVRAIAPSLEENNFAVYFDEDYLQIIGYNIDKYYTQYHYDDNVEVEPIFTDDYESLENIKGAIYLDNLYTNSENESDYYIQRGSLYKDADAIYKGSFFDWYRHSIISCWLTAVLGMAIAGMFTARLRRQKNKEAV